MARRADREEAVSSLIRKVAKLDLDAAGPAPIRRLSTGLGAEQAAQAILSLARETKIAPEDHFTTFLDGSDFEIGRFPGAVQRRFLEAHSVDDFTAGLAFAVERGWVSLGPRLGPRAEARTYVLKQAGLDSISKRG
jgi:hypothetical protein